MSIHWHDLQGITGVFTNVQISKNESLVIAHFWDGTSSVSLERAGFVFALVLHVSGPCFSAIWRVVSQPFLAVWMITYRFVSIESARIIGLHCIHSIDGWGVMIISVARKQPMRLIKSIVDHTRSMYESNAPSLLRSAALVVMLCVFIDTKYAVCTGQQRVCKPRGRGQLCIPTASHHRTSLSVCLLLMWCGWVVLLGPAAVLSL